jgi:hypothetical protein
MTRKGRDISKGVSVVLAVGICTLPQTLSRSLWQHFVTSLHALKCPWVSQP